MQNRFRRWLLAILLLPFTVMVVIPAGILLLFRSAHLAGVRTPDEPLFWLATMLAVVGAALSFWATASFFRYAEGTAAPWDPPTKFVVRGPYRYVRNPMILGVIFVLFAEAFLFRSWPIAVWACLFWIANAIYFPLCEEPALKQRFATEYEAYCRHVRRWIPRRTPWQQP